MQWLQLASRVRTRNDFNVTDSLLAGELLTAEFIAVTF